MKKIHLLILSVFLNFLLKAQNQIQTGVEWVNNSLTTSSTSPNYSNVNCSNISYTISTPTSEGFRMTANGAPFNNNCIIIPSDINETIPTIPISIIFNQTVSNVKIRFIDLDEDVNGFGVPEEYLTNISPPIASVSTISGVPQFFLIAGEVSPDDGAGTTNNNSSGWVNWTGNLDQITFDYIRPGTQYGLIIDSIYFECINSCDLTLNLGNDTTICNNTSLTIDGTDNLATNYLWSNGNTNNSLTINQAGTYWLEISNANCTVRDSIIISSNSISTINLGNDTIFCAAISIVLDANTANATYLWNNGTTGSNLVVNSPGTYWVNVQNGTCFDIDSIVITQNSSINFGFDTLLCTNENIVIDVSTPLSQYRWNTSETSSSISVNTAGNYSVEISNSCGLSTYFFDIDFESCLCPIYIPNSFTPNADEKNNVFDVVCECKLVDYTFLIFDRWGEIIFESHDQEIGWDATYGGLVVEDGMYVYNVSFINNENEKIKIVGHVSVIR